MENLSIHHRHWMDHTKEQLVVKSVGDFIFEQGQVDAILEGKVQKHHNKGDITTNVEYAFNQQSYNHGFFFIIKHYQSCPLEHRWQSIPDILAKIVEYCKRVVTQPPSDKNDVELKAFVSKLVNDNQQTCLDYMIKHKDPTHLQAFKHHARIFPRRRGKDAKR
ncbi:hypothetical protein M9H77_26377 [Catharanthus roseus]|uniref:Uncharacterized protein n=1 Tax=Catharanthus roseus TaxID=4058 RepID=A0ACC0ABN3_CATRO|nr:hypothetical protein M9H77_26377 [Catharanthus roseus]